MDANDSARSTQQSARSTQQSARSTESHAYTEFAITPAEALQVAQYTQRSASWLRARKWRLSGSNFAAAAGHNPYMSREALVREMLWGSFKGNDATQWGTEKEPVARDMYLWAMRQVHPELSIDEVGFQVCPEVPFLGVSPDGICTVWDKTNGKMTRYLLEIKCPYRWKRDKFYDDTVPTYYWDQLQGSMGLLGLPYCHFVVWTPVAMQVTLVHFDTNYWRDTLKPALLEFYLKLFYPTLCAWRDGKLTPPEIITDIGLVLNMDDLIKLETK